MEIFMYLFVFLAFFHIILTLDTKEMENIPINVEAYNCMYEKTGNYLKCDTRCKSGYKLDGATNLTFSIVSQRWMYIGKKPRCLLLDNGEEGMLPVNIEAFNCEFEKTGNFLNCNLRCKFGYQLIGATNTTLSVVSQKWMFIGEKPTCIDIKNELLNCPYPPKLPKNLTIIKCSKTNGRRTKCTLSCGNRVYMIGYNEIFCNMKTGKWVQENSRHIATTCQKKFDCKVCDSLKCPSTTERVCSENHEVCECQCLDWNSCDGFRCPLGQPESSCRGISSYPGICSCR